MLDQVDDLMLLGKSYSEAMKKFADAEKAWLNALEELGRSSDARDAAQLELAKAKEAVLQRAGGM